MLAIRLQRTGRSGHSQFRLIAQDSRFSPKRGRVTAYLGSYDPHTKQAQIDSKKIAEYLEKGAQPSNSAARLLQKEGVKLPDWVKIDQPKQRTVRHPEKRRSTRPAEAEAPAEPVATENTEVQTTTEEPVSEAAEPVAETEPEAPAEETPAEPAEEAKAEEPAAAETPADTEDKKA